MRAANSEMELRLQRYIDGAVNTLKTDQERFARGEFTDAQKGSIRVLIENYLKLRNADGYSRRERGLVILSTVISVLTLLILGLTATGTI